MAYDPKRQFDAATLAAREIQAKYLEQLHAAQRLLGAHCAKLDPPRLSNDPELLRRRVEVLMAEAAFEAAKEVTVRINGYNSGIYTALQETTSEETGA